MNAPTATAPTFADVEWRDLVALTSCEKNCELTLSLPWLILSLFFYANGWWWLGLPCSFYFFLTGLRQSHNAQHYSMGLPRVFQDLVLISYSMFFHAEHHLFPAVPTCHLAVLAKRLDAVTLKFAGQQVIETKLKAPT